LPTECRRPQSELLQRRQPRRRPRGGASRRTSRPNAGRKARSSP
jgi:hypothetical protein